MQELIHDLNGPRTAQQELFYDLEDAAAMIGWSVVELKAMAASDATQALILKKIGDLLAAQQDKLNGYAAEVKQQRIKRSDSDGPPE
ncbi:hypothetical protein Q1J45_05690 [Pseudomonas rhodesiae]|uniref:hypothetical protein n=1 Tax=unclassified Pseudomonas TaxID=196821 RepID=UPI002736DDB1|nr:MULTISPECIES: hypothetical protein [unclassified Pseudomonas]WLH38661.1 hypothetical protein PSH94_13605 [Pseudomonas sp. FP2254]